MYKKEQCFKCNYCGFKVDINDQCPKCQKKELQMHGVGIEQIEEKLSKIFPDKNIQMLSKELKDSAIEQIIHDMKNSKIDILVATQIISKGFNFNNLTLVGVIDDGAKIYKEDLRINEKIYQLLMQIAGRAGRAVKPGKVLIQSYQTQNKTLELLSQYKEDEFFNYEIHNRESFALPPFTKLVNIVITHKSKDFASKIANNLKKIIQENLKNSDTTDIKILGPVESIIFKLSNHYRYRILTITPKFLNVQKYIKSSLEQIDNKYLKYIKIDVDPQNLI